MTSRFTNLLQTKKAPEESAPKSRKAKTQKAGTARQESAAGSTTKAELQEIVVRRAVGKRSKTDFTQVSAYVPRDTHKRVKAALLDDGRDFSELVSDLLAQWLAKQ